MSVRQHSEARGTDRRSHGLAGAFRAERLAGPTRRLLLALALLTPSGAAAAEVPGAETPAEESTLTDYVIGVEDLIEISVWKNPDLSVTIPVRPDGKISLPLIADVTAAGLTPLRLKEVLTERLSAFVSSPEVSVLVKEVNSFKIYVVGEVARPGELKLKSNIRFLQAIALVGGFTSFADRSKIIVLRDTGDTELRFEINYNKVVSGSRPEDNIALLPRDTIVVP